jgi:hypothetical protein
MRGLKNSFDAIGIGLVPVDGLRDVAALLRVCRRRSATLTVYPRKGRTTSAG